MTDLPNILWRSLFSFITLLIIARFMGKKQISQFTFFDYIVGITIGNLAGDMSLDLNNTPVQNALIAIIIWGVLPIVVALITTKSLHFRKLINGKPTVLVQNGQIREKSLKRERMTADELMHLLREKDAFHLADVEFAVMETDGKLSVMKTTESQPITPKVQGMLVANEHEPRIVIMDGNVMEHTLISTGNTKEWLLGEVMKQGARDFQDVFLAQVDAKGSVYADLYSDEEKIPEIKARSIAAATLKKVQADLEMFALQTNVPHAKHLYTDEAKQIQQILERVGPYLKG